MRYVTLGAGSGLRVSEIVLGCGMFGTAWGYGAEATEARRMFDAYVEVGGNFFDTADTYQDGMSETILGELVGARRDELVVATKYTAGTGPSTLGTRGNSRKNMIQSVEASLRRLRTDRIDLLWVHAPDGVTAMEEIVRGFDDLSRAGKVLHGGLSNFAAWRVAHAQTLAELRGWNRLVAVQVEYSLVERDSDAEILPMAAAFGLSVTGWSPLGGGLLTGKYRRGETGRKTTWGTALIHDEATSPRTTDTLDTLEAIARETDANPGRVAIAWVRAKGVLPIIGPRTAEQAKDNLAAVSVTLSADQVARLDAVSAPAVTYPHSFRTRFPKAWENVNAGKTITLPPSVR